MTTDDKQPLGDTILRRIIARVLAELGAIPPDHDVHHHDGARDTERVPSVGGDGT